MIEKILVNSFTLMCGARSFVTITSVYMKAELSWFSWCSKTKLAGKSTPSFQVSYAGRTTAKI